MNLEARVAELERALAAALQQIAELQRWAKHSVGVTRAIRRAVMAWPGVFSPREIYDLVRRANVDVSYPAVSQRLMHMEKRGMVNCTRRGGGPVPNLYEYTGVHTGAGTPKGQHHCSTSGLICALRSALDDLPAEFNLEDAKAWVQARNLGKGRKIGPYLKALVVGGELEIARPRDRARGLCQLYRRAACQVSVTGQERSPAEIAWLEFRRSIKVDVPDILTPLEREAA